MVCYLILRLELLKHFRLMVTIHHTMPTILDKRCGLRSEPSIWVQDVNDQLRASLQPHVDSLLLWALEQSLLIMQQICLLNLSEATIKEFMLHLCWSE
ncbi:MAG: hypothetical protein [Cressdnaviricota sp.]|nr:MAG: hypothetical protein [Cressdnaviricota sp.]